ncbi:hypothetical protein [Gordonia phage MerCougar]|nr:hypothetical protein [Gordonia phage MerCougar]
MLRKLLDRLPRLGEWTPTVPFPLRAVILALWALEPISRGLDYITGEHNPTATLSKVEAAFPLWFWGLLCLASGILILTGFAGRWRRVSIIGLYFAGAAYIALACGFTAAVYERGGDGFRTPITFFVLGFTYWAAALGYAINQQPRLIVVDDDDDPDVKVSDGSPTADQR